MPCTDRHPHPVRDRQANGEEHTGGYRERRQRPADQRPGGDPKRHREYRAADRDDALEVEVALLELVLVERVQWRVPPGGEPSGRAAEDGAREQQPACMVGRLRVGRN